MALKSTDRANELRAKKTVPVAKRDVAREAVAREQVQEDELRVSEAESGQALQAIPVAEAPVVAEPIQLAQAGTADVPPAEAGNASGGVFAGLSTTQMVLGGAAALGLAAAAGGGGGGGGGSSGSGSSGGSSGGGSSGGGSSGGGSSPTPTYQVQSSAATVAEGGTVTFTIQTTNVANGTQLAYRLVGLDDDDLDGDSIEGVVTVQNGVATVTVHVRQDGMLDDDSVKLVLVGRNVESSVVDVSDTPAGETFVTNAPAEIIDGTDYDDTIYASAAQNDGASTLYGDVIRAGDGYDTIVIQAQTEAYEGGLGNSPAEVSGVEHVKIRAGEDVLQNFTAFDDGKLEKVTIERVGSANYDLDVVLEDLQDIVVVKLDDVAGHHDNGYEEDPDYPVDLDESAYDGENTVVIDYDYNENVSGDHDVQVLKVAEAQARVIIDEEIEAVSLVDEVGLESGNREIKDSTLDLDGSFTTVTVSGGHDDVTLHLYDAAGQDGSSYGEGLTTVEAAAFKGDLVLNLEGIEAAETGKGDDLLYIGLGGYEVTEYDVDADDYAFATAVDIRTNDGDDTVAFTSLDAASFLQQAVTGSTKPDFEGRVDYAAVLELGYEYAHGEPTVTLQPWDGKLDLAQGPDRETATELLEDIAYSAGVLGVAAGATIDTGNGDDFVLVGQVGVNEEGGGATITTGDDDDRVYVAGDVAHESLVSTGEGDDEVLVLGSMAGTVETDDGDDVVVLGELGKYVYDGYDAYELAGEVSTGSGDDLLVINSWVEGSVDMGADDDQVVIHGNADGQIHLDDAESDGSGNGDDTLTFHNGSLVDDGYGSALVHGGSEEDDDAYGDTVIFRNDDCATLEQDAGGAYYDEEIFFDIEHLVLVAEGEYGDDDISVDLAAFDADLEDVTLVAIPFNDYEAKFDLQNLDGERLRVVSNDYDEDYHDVYGFHLPYGYEEDAQEARDVEVNVSMVDASGDDDVLEVEMAGNGSYRLEIDYEGDAGDEVYGYDDTLETVAVDVTATGGMEFATEVYLPYDHHSYGYAYPNFDDALALDVDDEDYEDGDEVGRIVVTGGTEGQTLVIDDLDQALDTTAYEGNVVVFLNDNAHHDIDLGAGNDVVIAAAFYPDGSVQGGSGDTIEYGDDDADPLDDIDFGAGYDTLVYDKDMSDDEIFESLHNLEAIVLVGDDNLDGYSVNPVLEVTLDDDAENAGIQRVVTMRDLSEAADVALKIAEHFDRDLEVAHMSGSLTIENDGDVDLDVFVGDHAQRLVFVDAGASGIELVDGEYVQKVNVDITIDVGNGKVINSNPDPAGNGSGATLGQELQLDVLDGSIDSITLVGQGQVELTMGAGWADAGETILVDATGLDGGGYALFGVHLDASDVLDYAVEFHGSDLIDEVVGSAQDDFLFMGAGELVDDNDTPYDDTDDVRNGDVVRGRLGDDTIVLDAELVEDEDDYGYPILVGSGQGDGNLDRVVFEESLATNGYDLITGFEAGNDGDFLDFSQFFKTGIELIGGLLNGDLIVGGDPTTPNPTTFDSQHAAFDPYSGELTSAIDTFNADDGIGQVFSYVGQYVNINDIIATDGELGFNLEDDSGFVLLKADSADAQSFDIYFVYDSAGGAGAISAQADKVATVHLADYDKFADLTTANFAQYITTTMIA